MDLADEKALEMHDRSLALQTFQKQLAPVVQQLEDYAAKPGQGDRHDANYMVQVKPARSSTATP